MRYFPILEELFASDTIIFLIIGILVLFFVGLSLQSGKKRACGIAACFAIYIFCEIFSNIHTNYMFEIILLFVGTLAIGGGLGLIVCNIILFFRRRHDGLY